MFFIDEGIFTDSAITEIASFFIALVDSGNSMDKNIPRIECASNVPCISPE